MASSLGYDELEQPVSLSEHDSEVDSTSAVALFGERARLAALHDSRILDTPPDADFDEFAELAAAICGVPMAQINFIDAYRQWTKSSFGIEGPTVPRETSICSTAIKREGDVVIVPDAYADDDLADNPFVVDEPRIRFYAGAPIRSPEGHPLGMLCVLDRVPRSLNVEQAEALKTLAKQLATQVELRRSLRATAQTAATLNQNVGDLSRVATSLEARNRDLDETVEHQMQELRRTSAALRETLEERQRLARQLISAQELERRRIANEIHDDSLQVVTALGMRLQLLGQRIRSEEERRDLQSLEETLTDAITRLRRQMASMAPSVLDRGLAGALRCLLDDIERDAGVTYTLANRLGEEPPAEAKTVVYRIAQEAINNIRKHANASTIHVALDEHEGMLGATIRDDGVGFEPARRIQSPVGHLGLTTMRERAEMAGGTLEVSSQPGSGTTISVAIPTASTRPKEDDGGPAPTASC